MVTEIDAALVLSGIFFIGVFSVLRVKLFTGRYGRRHRLTGFVYLCWLVLGFLDVRYRLVNRLAYDAALGVLGTALTLTAAFDFRAAHSRVRNVASGALDDDATVTFSEMIEHSFYQGQNLVQILYLHCIRPGTPPRTRALLYCAAASPWLLRGRFPVNRFSDNWRRGQKRTATTLMYMVKKWQYVAYKHTLLFGLNATVCLTGSSIAGGGGFTRGIGGHHDTPTFRLYWVALNAAYTCEFFLQTLVRRGYLRQRPMLLLNQLLMVVSSIAAIGVLRGFVSLPLSALSLALNFRRGGRGRDFSNAVAVLAVGALLSGQLRGMVIGGAGQQGEAAAAAAAAERVRLGVAEGRAGGDSWEELLRGILLLPPSGAAAAAAAGDEQQGGGGGGWR